MKWMPRESKWHYTPYLGELRIIRKFLFFPKSLYSTYPTTQWQEVVFPLETRWLEFADIIQEWHTSSDGSRFIDTSWLEPIGKGLFDRMQSWKRDPSLTCHYLMDLHPDQIPDNIDHGYHCWQKKQQYNSGRKQKPPGTP